MSESSPLRYVTVEDFRRQHGLGRERVYQSVRRGELPHVKVGRKVLIPVDALDLLLRAQLTGARKDGANEAA